MCLSPFVPQDRHPLDVTITCRTEADQSPELRFAWHTAEDSRPRAFPLRRILLPWARPELPSGFARVPLRPEIQGGDWARGRELFFSERALCGKCHAVRGRGATLAPDLSNLTSRDYASVHRDIADPNAAINPDYVAHEVTLKNGTVVTAVVRPAAAGRIVLGLGAGAELDVAADDIVSKKPLLASIMPAKLDEALGERDFRDLMAFLLTEPPLMGVYAPKGQPGRRSRAEVAAAMAGAPSPAGNSPAQSRVCFRAPRPRRRRTRLPALARRLEPALQSGGPARHSCSRTTGPAPNNGPWLMPSSFTVAATGRSDAPATSTPSSAAAVASSSSTGRSKPVRKPAGWPRASASAPMPPKRNTAMARSKSSSIRPFSTRSPAGSIACSSSTKPTGTSCPATGAKPTILARAEEDGAPHPQFWTTEPDGGGRVFVSIPGHYSWTFDDPLFRLILLRGLAWSTREPVDRFNPLVEAGLE